MDPVESGSQHHGDQQEEAQPPAEQRKADEERAAMKGCIWIVGIVAIAAVAIAVIATSYRPGDAHQTQPPAVVAEPSFSWSPPGWLLGYWSNADNRVQAAAEPGLLEITLVLDGSVVSATIQEWSDERGDVFAIVHLAQGTSTSTEWGNTSREVLDDGLSYIAKAFTDDGVLVMSMQFRYAGQNTVEATLTFSEGEHYTETLSRDE